MVEHGFKVPGWTWLGETGIHVIGWPPSATRVAAAISVSSPSATICIGHRASAVGLCSAVRVLADTQPDQLGVDVALVDLRSDRNIGHGVGQEPLDVQPIGEQECPHIGG